LTINKYRVFLKLFLAALTVFSLLPTPWRACCVTEAIWRNFNICGIETNRFLVLAKFLQEFSRLQENQPITYENDASSNHVLIEVNSGQACNYMI